MSYFLLRIERIMTTVMTMVTSVEQRRRNRALPRPQLMERIEQAASRLFKKHGFDAVSVDQIVSEARVSKGTFFNFFPTKSDALIGYYHELDARLARLRDCLNPSRPVSALENFFRQAETLLRAEGPVVDALFRAIWTHPSLMKADMESATRDRRGFAAFFGKARERGSIGKGVDPTVAADVLSDLWSGAVVRWLADGRRFELAISIRPKLRLLFGGLGPKTAK